MWLKFRNQRTTNNPMCKTFHERWNFIGNSAKTPVPSTRNSAVDYSIAASIGVTDVRVQ